MGYTLKMFRNDVVVLSKYPDFLEDEKYFTYFAPKQYESLKTKLAQYKYEIESERDQAISYRFRERKNVTACLTKNCLTFNCEGGDEDQISELRMLSLEMCSKDLSILNVQEGTWETNVENKSHVTTGIEISDSIHNITSNASMQIEPTGGMKAWWKFW